MILNWKKVRIFIRPGATDFRKQINGLACIVQDEFDSDMFKGHLYLFCNRRQTQLKILYWDRNGFCLWLKRLEHDRFPWPRTAKAAREIRFDQLAMLLDGIDFFNAHQTLPYTSVT